MAYTSDFQTQIVDNISGIVSAQGANIQSLIVKRVNEGAENMGNHETDRFGVRTGQTQIFRKDALTATMFPIVDDACEQAQCDMASEFVRKEWRLNLAKCRLDICLGNEEEDFLAFWEMYRHTQQGAPNMQSAFLVYLNRAFADNLGLATRRLTWFTDSSETGDAYLEGEDGLFPQLDAAPADNKITIAKNAELTYTEQRMDGAEVVALLDDMYTKAMRQGWLLGTSDIEYNITPIMAVEYVAYLNSLTRGGQEIPAECSCIDPNTLVASDFFDVDKNLFYRGKKINVRYDWEVLINGLPTLNGGGGDSARVKPNRAVLSSKRNLLRGTPSATHLDSYAMFWNEDTEKVVLRGSTNVGGMLPFENEAIYAS